MKMFNIWDKETPINNMEASYFLNQNPFKNYSGDIILIYADNGKVSNIECKDILAEVYGIDVTLDTISFMQEYFKKLKDVENNESVE